MTLRYDTYGFGTLGLDEALRLVGDRLELELEPRDSGYFGGRYYHYRLDSDRRLALYRNRDASGAPIKREFAAHDVLLDVSNVDDMDAIQRRLTEGYALPVLLKSKEIVDDEDDEES